MLKLLSSMASKEVLAAAAALYRESCAVDVETRSAGGVDVAKRVESGEAVDIVVLAQDAIDTLIANGRLSAQGRTNLMSSTIAIAVRAGASRPVIDDEAAVKTAVLEAASISYSTGPSGRYLEGLFERWGILATIRARIVVPPPGIAVARLIESGQVQLGFQQMSELAGAPGVDVIGTLPPSMQLVTTFTAALTPLCLNRRAAHDFVSFLASPGVDAIRQRHGMSSVG